MKNEQLTQRALDAFAYFVKDVPFVRLENTEIREGDKRPNPDLVFEIGHHGRTRHLIAECISIGEPRSVRTAVFYLLAHKQDADGVILIAPYLSPEAAAICEASGVSYLDLSGNGRFVLENPDLYVSKQNFVNAFPQRRSQQSLYTPKSERILRALMTKPQEHWTLTRIVQKVQVSIGQAFKVKDLLVEREWLDTKGGLRLSHPEHLLDEWTIQSRKPRNKTEGFYTVEPLASWEARLAQVCREKNVRYALTGLAAASRYAFYTRYQRTSVYLDGDINELMNALSIKRVSTGANILILTPYDDGVFYEAHAHGDDAVLVCPVQAYLDLATARGRDWEAAAHLRREVIEKPWRSE